ncbi:M23 family metallopeptidase [uncultured Cyclobacterium sp.]|uniref:M23 family metallopeptidase n=1 Tax=uncultured Cyclobacterium sp. TaxID=453820 RepID=UPI0030EF2096
MSFKIHTDSISLRNQKILKGLYTQFLFGKEAVKPLFQPALCYLLIFVFFSACQAEKLFKNQNPYENYLNTLNKSGLENYGIAQRWIKKGKLIHASNMNSLNLPYNEMTYFDPSKVEALFLRYKVKEGNKVSIKADLLTDSSTTYFTDVFRKDADEFTHLHYSKDQQKIEYTVRQDGEHVLRVQPELLGGGAVVLSIEVSGSLAFPLPDMQSNQIASFWGDARSGGARKHEGVDVFAKRGTPVRAVVNGVVRRTGQNRLGGNVVWVNSGRYNYYYAHLDSQLVREGQTVVKGDTLGTVGNTGNAITTAPHLHFGIYRRGRGAVDPFPFIQAAEKPKEIAASDSVSLREYGIIAVNSGNLRTSPDLKSKVIAKHPKFTFFDILAKSGAWFRIQFPDQSIGFAHQSILEISNPQTKEIALESTDALYAFFDRGLLPSSNFVGQGKVLGTFENMVHIQLKSGIRIWMKER